MQHQDQPTPKRPHRFVRNFGKLLREAREAAGWTQRELSERLNESNIQLDTSAITRMEKGQREPRLREAIEISELLDFSLDLVGAADLTEIGGEAQFARGEELMRRNIEAARAKILDACYQQHFAFDGIFSDDEQAGILARRGVSNPHEWMEEICRQLEFSFRRNADELGRANYYMYADEAERSMLERMVTAITTDLFRSESEVYATTEQERKKSQGWLLQSARENLLAEFGPDEFQRRFGTADFES